ncbi:MAG: death on curing protein [Segetibacter sp.]|nr:death on curing protein [Segetibacter sp.]
MILIEDIVEMHDKSVNDFGGMHGIRDQGLLESAIARPFQTFGGNDLYGTIFEKAAALGESLIINHPFVDGNKRTGMLAMATFLLNYNRKFIAKSDSLYNFIIDISTGSISFEEIVRWLQQNTKEL